MSGLEVVILIYCLIKVFSTRKRRANLRARIIRKAIALDLQRLWARGNKLAAQ